MAHPQIFWCTHPMDLSGPRYLRWKNFICDCKERMKFCQGRSLPTQQFCLGKQVRRLFYFTTLQNCQKFFLYCHSMHVFQIYTFTIYLKPAIEILQLCVKLPRSFCSCCQNLESKQNTHTLTKRNVLFLNENKLFHKETKWLGR